MWANITSQKAQNIDYKVWIIQKILTSYKKGIPRTAQEGVEREWGTADLFTPQEKPDLPRKGSLIEVQDLNMQVQGCQKAAQWERKMKPSSVHR